MSEEVKKTIKKAAPKKAAKKAVKKTAVKKETTKKAAKPAVKKSASKKAVKSAPKKALKKAHGEQQFFLADGKVISDLISLADAFDGMMDEVYYHHVCDGRNDFANWVGEILKEEKLAEELMSAGSKDRCQIVVLRHLM